MKTDALELKKALLLQCKANIQQRINTIETVLESITESRNNESKSSVGDKYETGRAMMQLEEEKNKTQLAQAIRTRSILSIINPEKQNTKVELGSLVFTPQYRYFISVGLGKMTVEDQLIYAISPESPIGQVLLNHKVGEEVLFNQRVIEIVEIV